MAPCVAALRHVREDELDALKARLARHLPHSVAVYGSLSLAARYGLHSLRPASILVPVDPRPTCLTIIAPLGSENLQITEVFWSPEEHTVKDVAQYLSLIPDLDWSKPLTLIGIPKILLPALKSLDSIGGRQVQVQERGEGHIYNLETPPILGTELPPMYHMSSLKEDEASTVWTNWEFNFTDTEDNMRQDIIHFPSVGIREHSFTNSAEPRMQTAKETLVSWIRTTKYGWMGNTFTLLHHRRRGLASRATLALARQMLQEGFFANAAILDNNTVSIKFHEDLGFKRQCAIDVVALIPAETTGKEHLE